MQGLVTYQDWSGKQARERGRPGGVAGGNKKGKKQLKETESGVKNKGPLNTSGQKEAVCQAQCLSREEHLHSCTSAVKGHGLQRK